MSRNETKYYKMEDQVEVRLERELHESEPFKYLATLRKKGILRDCMLEAKDERQIHVHKVILSAFSPIFEGLILGQDASTHPILTCKVEFEVLEALVELMYKGKIIVRTDQHEKLMKLCKSIKIRGSIVDVPINSTRPQSPQVVSSRGGSKSPVVSVENEDDSMEYQGASNSSDITKRMKNDRAHSDPATSMRQIALNETEYNNNLIKPMSEHRQEHDESIVDLTEDDDMSDTEEHSG